MEAGASPYARVALSRRAAIPSLWAALCFLTSNIPAPPICWKQSVRIDPGEAYGYNALGIAYLEQADFAKAIPAFRDAARRAPNWSYPLHNLALAYVEAGDYRRRYPQLSASHADHPAVQLSALQSWPCLSAPEPAARSRRRHIGTPWRSRPIPPNL